jgi:hypothetical protein
MFHRFITPIIFLALSTPHLFQASGLIKPEKHKTFLLPKVAPHTSLTVSVQGNGNGDIDCFLLQDKKIVVKNETYLDSCVLTTVPKPNAQLKLWIVNHGNKTDKFSIVVDTDK